MKDHSLSVGRFALNRVAVAAAVAVLSALPISASALGLGKLSVKSALGEPLRAEIDISSINPEESSTLQVRVASPETYRAAGVDYNAVLSGASIVLQRRADGRPYLRISSDRPVQEPFVDVILDLGWSAGRLVREYTLLFDPPSMRSVAQPAAPVMSVPPVATAPSPALRPSRPAPVRQPEAQAPVARTTPAAPRPAPAAQAADQGTVAVRSGDTLSSIASRNLPSGVSLDQMLVGLYRQNPSAFQGDNMNRLRSGAVLTLPSSDQAKAVSPSEARQFIVAQSADFATYRQRLAGAVGVEATTQTQRQAKGKVEAEVQDRKQAAAPTPDKLTLSKGAVSSAASAAEDRLAKARATQDNSTRVAELSKNLDELRKLKEQAAVVAAASQPVAPALPAVASQAAEAASAASAAASAAELAASAAELVASAASDVASMAEAASEVMAPVAVASQPDVAPVPPVVAQDEPGFLASLNPMWLAAGGAGLALLAGAAMFLRSRRRADTGETSFLESRLQPDSFFGASGGQRVDTRDATAGPSSMSYSLSQLDAIGDVDPVAEADVYLAYGRDLQAEEILKEALRSTPDRLAVRVKLLEVYAKRRDTKGYESLATQLFGLTNGAGEEWLKTQELGLSIDPENPLYQPGGQPGGAVAEAAAPDFLGASTVPHSVAPGVLDTEPAPADALVDLDLDANGRDSHQDGVSDSVSPQVQNGDHLADLELPDLDSLPSGEIAQTATPADKGDIDFDLSLDDLPQAPAVAPAPAAAPVTEPTPSGSMPFDLGDISLDLDAPAPAKSSFVTDEELDHLPVSDAPLSADQMARKFDLAQEFRQIGDVDGARELLQEVVDNAQDGSLKSRAQTMLDSLG